MNLILHDLSKTQWQSLNLKLNDDTQIIEKSGDIRRCVGCFGCWVKTPGQCVIADEYQKMGELLARTDELIIVSECSFGSYSSFIKNVLDRSISYVLPFFEMRKGEMHHQLRYKNQIRIRAFFYGTDISNAEKETAKRLVEANALNFNGSVEEVVFAESIEQLRDYFA